jgi:glucan phosphoethanolaminetransferase (alkaline phosphatase superfamily)
MGAILLVAILPGLLIKPNREFRLNWAGFAIPLAAFALTFHVLGNYQGSIEEFPSTVATPIKAYLAINQSNSLYLGNRDTLVYDKPLKPEFDKVVLIVDESIRGDYLQLNNENFDNTPFLAAHKSELANFGVAVANANCSALARLALRSGVRDTDYPDPKQRVLHQPTFWQYAKAAGYRTIYIDGWFPLRKMHSFITYDELKYVDKRVEVNLRPYWDADNKLADKLTEALSLPGKSFIFVEKIGLHSPYQKATVEYNSDYEPSASSIRNPDLPEDQQNDVLQYSKGVRLRVDSFFARVWSSLQQPNVLTVYTSDHGQSMYEGGYLSSHCTGLNAVKGEGLVPLFLATGNKDILAKFQRSAQQSFGRADHNDIFPTLISAMGYNPDDVAPPYSSGLIDVDTVRQRSFIVGSPFRRTVDRINVDERPAAMSTIR